MATRTVDLGPVIGPQGPKGDTGPGVPAGGAAGQILVKVDATNFNSVWKSLIDAGIFKADGSVPMTGPIHWNGSTGDMSISTDGFSLVISGPNGDSFISITDDGRILLSGSSIGTESPVWISNELDLGGGLTIYVDPDNSYPNLRLSAVQASDYTAMLTIMNKDDVGEYPAIVRGVAFPVQGQDAANKIYVDTFAVPRMSTPNQVYGTDASGNPTVYPFAQSSATANSIPRRTASGQIFAAAPTATEHAANKYYVDNINTAYGASGTATAITIPAWVDLRTLGWKNSFVAAANNNGAATTINGKPLYKPNTTTAPTLIAGNMYTVRYDTLNGGRFFIDKDDSGGGGGSGDFKADGSVPMTGALSMGGKDVKNVGALDFGETVFLTLEEATGDFVINLKDYDDKVVSLTGLRAPTLSHGAATKGYVDSMKSKQIAASLTAAGWTGSGPYTQTVTVTGLGATQNAILGLPITATAAQRTAARAAQFAVTTQAANSITITADGNKPTISIPIVLTVLS